MEPFLKQIAVHLKETYPSNLKEQTVVFANRRAAIFFSKYLKELHTKPFWSPKIITISDLFETICDGVKTDKLSLLFELYQSYNYILKTSEPFDKFYYWGNMMLRDFDEIDKYLINADVAFSTISAHKEIDNLFDFIDEEQKAYLSQFWKVFQEAKETSEKTQFEGIWSKLSLIYKDLNKRLEDKGYFYEGKLYRNAIEKLRSEEVNIPYSNLHIAGFNALNNCEKQLFNRIRDKKLGHFYWDGDQYYLKQHFQEAGLFLRKNINQYPSPLSFKLENDLGENIKNSNIKINTYGVGMEIGQAVKTGELLEELNIDTSKDQTAVILPDEDLLMPVLQSTPKHIDKINISMGYGLKSTPLYALIENTFQLYLDCLQRQNWDNYFYKPLLGLLNHPYLFENDEVYRDKLNQLQSLNQQLIQKETIPKGLVVDRVLKGCQTPLELNQLLLDTLFLLYNRFDKEEGRALEVEFIYHTYLQIKKFDENWKSINLDIDLKTYIKLFRQILNDIAVPFVGEPLNGLQIMGVLETRSLDFQNVFILSMNEGKMPANTSDRSFIPYSLRKGYGLPTVEEYDAVYAYYFYRLIQRAENVYLFYNNIQEGDVKSEQSRFLHQIMYELNNGQINVTQQLVNYIQSEEDIINLSSIDSFLDGIKEYKDPTKTKYLTPSAINKLIDCQLAFYLKYIVGLYPKDEISEEVDSAQFGNVLHDTMELLYTPFNGKEVSKDAIDSLIKKVDNSIDKVIQNIFGLSKDKLQGEYLIIKNIVKDYINQILKKDKSYAPFKILGLETKPSEILGATKSGYRIAGKIDRIDEKNGIVRIIDYKTGSVNFNFKDYNALIEESSTRNKVALQAFTYSSLFQKKHPKFGTVTPFIISVRDLYASNNTGKFECKSNTELLEKGTIETLSNLGQDWLDVLDDYFENTSLKTSQICKTENERICEFCDFKKLCNR